MKKAPLPPKPNWALFWVEHFQLLDCNPPRGLDTRPPYTDLPGDAMLDEEPSIYEINLLSDH